MTIGWRTTSKFQVTCSRTSIRNRRCACRCLAAITPQLSAPNPTAEASPSSSFTICGADRFSNALDETLDGVFAGDDADEVSLRIDHGGKTETGGAEALDDSIGRLGVARDDDAAHVTGEGF